MSRGKLRLFFLLITQLETLLLFQGDATWRFAAITTTIVVIAKLPAIVWQQIES